MAYSTTPLQKPSHIASIYRGLPVAIVPTDGAAIGPFEGLYVGGAGIVQLVPPSQTTPVAFTVVAGQILPVPFQGINATGTTATLLVGLG